MITEKGLVREEKLEKNTQIDRPQEILGGAR